MCSQTQEDDIIIRMDSCLSKFSQKTVLTSCNRVILPMHYNSWYDSFRIIKLTCKTWDQRQENIDFECLFIMKSCEDAFIESVGNLIFDNNAAFDCRYKKLFLNVDEVLS